MGVFRSATGHTQAGTVSAAVTVAVPATNGKIALSALPSGGSLITYLDIYRTAANGTAYLFLVSLSNGTTSYTDNIADSALGVGAPTTNTTDDWYISMLIKSARMAAEGITNRALVTQTWDYVLDRFPGWGQYIPLPTLQSIVSITYVDTNGATQTLDPSQYLVDARSEPGRIEPAFGLVWPITRWQMNAVTIRFTCGYGTASDVPDGIKNWMLMRIKTLWDNRSEISVDTRITMVELPPEFVDGLLNDYACDSFCWALE